MPGASVLGINGQILGGELRAVGMELDKMATPNFDDFDFRKYVDADNPGSDFREIPYYTSRGCPARCNFCMDYKMWDLRYRQKSPQRIIEEMELLFSKYKIKDFMLIELIFNGHIAKMREFARELIAKNHQFSFWGHGRIDHRMDLETLDLLKQAGFRWFIFGLESASDKVLKLMRKGYSAETAENVISDMAKVGMDFSCNIVTGFPGENWEDYLQTIHFIWRHQKAIGNIPGMAACMATQGSDIYMYPEKFNIKVPRGQKHPDSINWETLDGTNTPEVREFRKEFMLAVFKQFNFKKLPQKNQVEYDILKMPEPQAVYQKLKGQSIERWREYFSTII